MGTKKQNLEKLNDVRYSYQGHPTDLVIEMMDLQVELLIELIDEAKKLNRSMKKPPSRSNGCRF